ncbi:MAG: response regulator [Myxococcales bacterium]|nr:response regulator [Myxococcales bacterium]
MPAHDVLRLELARLSQAYAERAPAVVSELVATVRAGALAEARVLVHTLKGNAGTFGLPALSEAAELLEQALLAPTPAELEGACAALERAVSAAEVAVTLPAPKSLPTTDLWLHAGTRIGNLEVRGVLGEGGMGVLLDGYDHGLGRRVALKIARDDSLTDLLRKEARALGAVRHPGVVQALALLEHEGRPVLVMERLFGRTLADHLAARAVIGARYSVDEVVHILTRVAEALVAVHEAGLSHRDLKPSNLMLTSNHGVVLLDFGVAVAEVHAHRGVGATACYAAPEQVAGRVRPGEGPLVDLYSLGVLGYELLVGALPTAGAVSVAKVLEVRADVPRALVEILGGLLREDPSERLESAEALLWELDALVRGRRRGRDRELLVVEDSPPMQAILRAILTAADPMVHVHVAESAEEALRVLDRQRIDLMVVDLGLPTMSGLELVLYLRGADRHVPVVAISGRATPGDRKLLRAAGVVEFVAKGPQFPDALTAAYQRLVRGPTSARGIEA